MVNIYVLPSFERLKKYVSLTLFWKKLAQCWKGCWSSDFYGTNFKMIQQALELSNGSLMTVSGERCDGPSAPPHHSPVPSPRPGPPSRTGPPAAPLEDQPVGGAGRTFAQLMSEKVARKGL
jgi:hypothetical protein